MLRATLKYEPMHWGPTLEWFIDLSRIICLLRTVLLSIFKAKNALTVWRFGQALPVVAHPIVSHQHVVPLEFKDFVPSYEILVSMKDEVGA